MGAGQRNFVRALVPELVPIVFSFRPNGAGAVAQSTIVGEGIESVTRQSAGVFDVVLKKPWHRYRGFNQSVHLDTAVPVIIVAKYTASTKTVRLTVFKETATVGGDANTQFQVDDIADATDNVIGGTLWMSDSTVGK